MVFDVIGEGRPFYVLHGGPQPDASYLRPWLEPLAKGPAAGVQVVLVDHAPGITALEDLEAIRRELGHDRIVLFGHAAGGALAQAYAARHPFVVDTLILCAAPGLPEEILRRVVAPTLILGGRQDDVVTPEECDRVFKAIDDAELVMFERSAHFPFASQPEVFHQLVAGWLERQDARVIALAQRQAATSALPN